MAAIVPAEVELILWRGADFLEEFQILLSEDPDTPMDLTGYTINSEIRAQLGFENTLIATFDINITDAENGRFTIGLDKTVTDDITQDVGFFDIIITDGSDFSEPYFYGTVQFNIVNTDVIP